MESVLAQAIAKTPAMPKVPAPANNAQMSAQITAMMTEYATRRVPLNVLSFVTTMAHVLNPPLLVLRNAQTNAIPKENAQRNHKHALKNARDYVILMANVSPMICRIALPNVRPPVTIWANAQQTMALHVPMTAPKTAMAKANAQIRPSHSVPTLARLHAMITVLVNVQAHAKRAVMTMVSANAQVRAKRVVIATAHANAQVRAKQAVTVTAHANAPLNANPTVTQMASVLSYVAQTNSKKSIFRLKKLTCSRPSMGKEMQSLQHLISN